MKPRKEVDDFDTFCQNEVTIMNHEQPIKQAAVTEAEFVTIYGEYPVAIDSLPVQVTINHALAMEASYCPATPDKRTDEVLRLTQLAKYVGRKALLPEHQWLLPQNPSDPNE